MTAVPPRRVLVVDDNRDAADTTAGLLRLAGCDVRVCYDGPSALAEAAGFDPDVCLLDLQMPGMGGDALAARLRVLLPAGGRPPLLVAVTAQSDRDSRRRTAAAGFQLHLVKPVAASDLVAVAGPQPSADTQTGATVAALTAALAGFPPGTPVRFGLPELLTFDRVVQAADGAAHVLFREVGGVEYGPLPAHRQLSRGRTEPRGGEQNPATA